jgi:hypothetical protein
MTDRYTSLTDDGNREVYAESGVDFSSGVCSNVKLSDLDPISIEKFRNIWD